MDKSGLKIRKTEVQKFQLYKNQDLQEYFEENLPKIFTIKNFLHICIL